MELISWGWRLAPFCHGRPQGGGLQGLTRLDEALASDEVAQRKVEARRGGR